MGNDGGTIARGQDLRAIYAQNGGVSQSSNQKKIDNLQNSLLSVCALTSLPLFEHGSGHAVVSDSQGRLYLKEKLLEFILSKKSGAKKQESLQKLPHIKGLGDFIDTKITWSPSGEVVCPITSTTKTPRITFAYLRECGCVISEKLIKDIRAHRKVSDLEADTRISDHCPNCNVPFVFNYDIVMLNPERDPILEKFNSKNIAFLKNELFLSHSKKALKKERSKEMRHKKKPAPGKVQKS